MQISFLKLTEAMDGPPIQGSGGDTKSIQVIRSGMESEARRGNFWDVFLRLCNNTDGMADLLEVRPDQLARMTSKIRTLAQEAGRNPVGQKKVMMPTGEFSDGENRT